MITSVVSLSSFDTSCLGVFVTFDATHLVRSMCVSANHEYIKDKKTPRLTLAEVPSLHSESQSKIV